MKNLIAAITLLMIFTLSNAQVTFGLRGGINSSNVRLGISNFGDYSLDYARSGLGFHIGGISQIKISGFFIQPELLFTSARADFQLSIHDVANPDTVNGEQRFYRIDVPVIAGYKLGPVKLQAGPVLIMNLGSNSDIFDDNNIRQKFAPVTIGYQLGAGVELSSLLLDIKYEGNFGYTGESMDISGTQYNLHQWVNQWMLSLGFLFGNNY